MCDSDDDCGDDSDESEELCADFKCDTTRKFQCKNRKCIPVWQMCNGKDDCGDGSDENNHTLCKKWPTSCSYNQFKCANEKCISLDKLCNHNDDCGDKSDERGCHVGHCTKEDKGGCKHACINLADLDKNSSETNKSSGYLCTCPKGYVIDPNNTKHCIDIDECSKFGNNCSQICVNVEGSYFCKCKNGFRLIDDHCVAEDESLFIFFANGPDIRAIDYEQQRQDLIITGQSRIQSIDYDPIDNIVYWTDTYERNIKRAFIPDLKDLKHGSEHAQSLDIKFLSKPADLAIDWVARNLYWCDNDITSSRPRGQILVSLLDGRYKRTLINNNLERPTSIALLPEQGLMFWTDAGISPKIEYSWMDGSKRKILVNEKLGFPSGIVIDTYQQNRVYWADSKLNVIESCFLDGTDRLTVISGELYHPFSLELFEDQLYWVTRDTGEIFRQDKFGRGVKVRMRRSYATDKKNYKPGFGGGSVLFRTGTNIEFGNNSFLDNGDPIENGFNLGDLKTSDFSNPMYETIKTNETNSSKEETASAIYEVPEKSLDEKSDKKSTIGSMVSSFSSIITRNNLRDPSKLGSLNPSSVDTGKDTQQLVEEDKSEYCKSLTKRLTSCKTSSSFLTAETFSTHLSEILINSDFN
ncbi:hypothetical protein RND71_043988 [Anisodus tanguticus]|uniref:EGF-like domain-containing protein n=1 Tax=Anisodus tanguticus TaxID=243964 RepID=A0AAE1QNR1_9SOLA|nr:hypothetical protein RND71_043988 [Anisodus tanguticus]